jgi:hypothetical protein
MQTVFSVVPLRGYITAYRVLFSERVQCSWEFSRGVLTRISIAKIRYQETSSEDIAEE